MLMFFFAMTSGLLRILVVKPPSMGTEHDRSTGAARPVAFKKDASGQYIFEGFAGAGIYMMGGTGIMLIERSVRPNANSKTNVILATTGCILFALAYNLVLAFVREKVPNYLSPQ